MRIQRFHFILFLTTVFLFTTCEEPTKSDTTPPTVTITFPIDGSTVNEMVTINCVSTDNKGVEKVELLIDGVLTGQTDETEPYSFKWNTTLVEDGSHTILVKSYDTSGNRTDSDLITVIVDNNISLPTSVSIQSVVYSLGGFDVIWTSSKDGDFKSYTLDHSIESQMSDYEDIYTTSEVTDTTYKMEDVNPTILHYFRVTVKDTFDYQTKGSIVSSSVDPVPTSVNVTSVTYTLEEMTVTWEESTDDDFEYYRVLYSESEGGEKDTLKTITVKTETSLVLTEFNPIQQNWFWVMVTDTLGLNSTGGGMSNEIDSQPSKIDVSSVTYDLEKMTITWSQSPDEDFHSYDLSYSETETGEMTSITIITDKTDTSYSITDFDPTQENWFWIVVFDHWGLTSTGNGMSNTIDNPPTPSELNSIIYENDSFNLSWSQNSDSDFKSYILYESSSEDMSDKTSVFESEDRVDTTCVLTMNEGLVRYYQLVVEDYWGLQSSSNTRPGSSTVTFLKTFVEGEGRSVQQTSDGGYIITGEKQYDGLMLFKTNSVGDSLWLRIFKGSGSEIGYSVKETTDGGYVITGWTNSFGNGGQDVWLIKTDSQGNEEWNKTFGESDSDRGYSVQQTSDGGYIIIGKTRNVDDGYDDIWLIKTDSQGTEEWNKKIGTGLYEYVGYSGEQTSDGGYIITGHFHYNNDIVLHKTDSNGNEEWNKIFRIFMTDDKGYSVKETTDGGYVITGYTGNGNIILLKTDSNGNEEWSQTFGSGVGYSVEQTLDGGYVITGMMYQSGNDVYLIKTDSNGNEEWKKVFGDTGRDEGYSVQQTTDGGYVITGRYTTLISWDGDTYNVLLIKTDSEGNSKQ